MTQTIEQLTARVRELEEQYELAANLANTSMDRVRELEEENARLKEIEQTNDTLLDQLGDKNAALLDKVASQKHCYAEAVANWRKQLAASQAYAEQLREAIEQFLAENDPSEFGCACDPSVGHLCGPCFAHKQQAVLRKAISLHRDTSALDAYVSEKVKEATAGHVEDIRFKDKEIEELRRIRMARFNNEDCWIFQGDGEDHLESLSCPVVVYPHVLMTLTRQRDLAVEALEWACGEKQNDEGKWFDAPDGAPKYWWRTELRKALPAIKESEK